MSMASGFRAVLGVAALLPAVVLGQASTGGGQTTPNTPNSQTITTVPPQNPSSMPPGFGRFGPSYLPPPTSVAQPANAGAPLFGQSWPRVGPDPAPRPIGLGRCPPGYSEPSSSARQMHLVVCIVQQPNTAMSYGRLNAGTGNGGNTAGSNVNPTQPYPSAGASAQSLSSLPASQERSQVNQCIGRPAGSYACGRGGMECCGSNQNNMCFPGAFACSPTGMGLGPKTACCISK